MKGFISASQWQQGVGFVVSRRAYLPSLREDCGLLSYPTSVGQPEVWRPCAQRLRHISHNMPFLDVVLMVSSTYWSQLIAQCSWVKDLLIEICVFIQSNRTDFSRTNVKRASLVVMFVQWVMYSPSKRLKSPWALRLHRGMLWRVVKLLNHLIGCFLL